MLVYSLVIHMKALLTNIVIASTLFASGYCVGSQTTSPAQHSNLPIAKGFLDIPNTYTISQRTNKYNERVLYLQDPTKKVEWPLIDTTIPLIESYMGNGKYVMEGAMKTVATSRKMFSLAGKETYKPQLMEE